MDNAAIIFLCILLASPLLLILGAVIADKSRGNSPINKLMESIFNNFLKDNRNPPPTYRGKRGGKYTLDESKKTKRPYRRYF